MAHISNAVEYGLHCLLFLTASNDPASARDLGELQGVSPEYVAKLFTRMEKAGLVTSVEGVDGGFSLARPPNQISVLEVIDAIDGEKPLFDCQQIRTRCAVFDNNPPAWASRGVCAVHAVMLEAEKKMRDVLAAHTLADIGGRFGKVAPAEFGDQVVTWLTVRKQGRRGRATVKVDQRKKK